MVCCQCGHAYLDRDGIPDLVVTDTDRHDYLQSEARQWDEQADRYDSCRRTDPSYMVAVKAAANALAPMRGELILEAGCGTGQVLKSYLRPGIRVIGLDLSLESLRYLRAKALPAPFALVRGEIASLPFPSEVFDRVLCANTLQQVPSANERQQAVAELSRVARPGALVVVTVHHYSLFRRWAGLPKEGPSGSHSGPVQFIHRFAPEEFHALLCSHLSVEAIYGAKFRLPYRFKLASLSRRVERFCQRIPALLPFADMLIGIGRRPEIQTGSY
jgi:SAM-dependent methyltransferase